MRSYWADTTYTLSSFNFYKFVMPHLSVYEFLKGIYLHIYNWVPLHTWYRVNDTLGFNLGFNIDFPLSLLYPLSFHSLRKVCWLFFRWHQNPNSFYHFHVHTPSASHLDYGKSPTSLPSSTLIPLRHIYIQPAAKQTLKSKLLLKPKSSPVPISSRRPSLAHQGPVCWPVSPLWPASCCCALCSLILASLQFSHISRTLQPQSLCSNCLLCLEHFPLALWVPNSLTHWVLAQMLSFKMGPHLFEIKTNTSSLQYCEFFLNVLCF